MRVLLVKPYQEIDGPIAQPPLGLLYPLPEWGLKGPALSAWPDGPAISGVTVRRKNHYCRPGARSLCFCSGVRTSLARIHGSAAVRS